MSSSGPSSGEQEVHRGYDLETGLLSQARQWVDVLPWLRLLRTLRVAGSPPLLLLTAIVFAVWLLGRGWIDPHASPPPPTGTIGENVSGAARYLRQLVPPAALQAAGAEGGAGEQRQSGLGRSAGLVLWSILVWTPLAMLLARQGALLTAHRALVPLVPGIALALRRTPAGWLTALIPLLCILPFLAVMLFLAWLANWFDQWLTFQWLAAAALAVMALPCGLLAFGAHIAIPLSWAALVNERDPDALDALSRGYEYLWRRPVSLLIYGVIAAGLLGVTGGLGAGVAWSASALVITVVQWVSDAPDLAAKSAALLWRLPVIIVLAQAWALAGGIYLLVRGDANGQEVEDVWQPPAIERVALPDLPN